MKRLRQLTLAVAAITALASGVVMASSHREAPFITKNPKVDSTDFYMFQSYEAGKDGGFTTLIANYQPFQEPGGGPNYFMMDPEAIYEIHIDNNGDAVEDITFQFDFDNVLSNGGNGAALNIGNDGGVAVAVPLINVGPGGTVGPSATSANGLNVLETYKAKILRGPRRAPTSSGDVSLQTATAGLTAGATTFKKPLDYAGRKTFGDANGDDAEYTAYANAHIYSVTIPGCTGAAKMFVGQRAEPFAVNLGPIFDLVNAPAAVITDAAQRNAAATSGSNPYGKYNISTIALEVPTSCLTQSGSQPVIGGWQTASVRQARVINPKGAFAKATREGGAWTQVSRLGSPLVNEVVIGLPHKDLFNTSEPKDDAQAAVYVTNPTLPALIQVLFPTAVAPKVFPRADLVAAFLTGVPGVNAFPAANNPVASEMLRLNTALPTKAKGAQNSLGAALCFIDKTNPQPGDLKALSTTATGCDPAGFPNGRRPGDDVVDIALTVSMGFLFSRDADAPARGIVFHDAILQDDSQFPATFPYLNTPIPGAKNGGI